MKFLTAPAKLKYMGRFASTVEFYARYREPYPPMFFKKVAEQIALRGDESLLDVGCGPGLLAIGFAPLVGRCTGLDPETGMIAAAKAPNVSWLDLERAAVVEVTSEQKEYPVESALVAGETRGWRAADSGTQTIRLIFDEPQRLKRIALVFEETETGRTQEFVLRWSGDGGRSFREIVRQPLYNR